MPLSKDPAKRARQLANLRPGAGKWDPGAAPNLKHGGYTREPYRSPIFSDARHEVVETIASQVPLRGPDGEVLPEFRLAVDMAAVQLTTLKRLLGYSLTHGYEDERGRPRLDLIEAEQRALDRMRKWLHELAATPAAWSRAGLDVARAERERRDLALQWADSWTRELAEGAGAELDADAEEEGE